MTTGLSASIVRITRCHNVHCMGLLKLVDCINSVWELCTCLISHHDSTDNDVYNVSNFRLLDELGSCRASPVSPEQSVLSNSTRCIDVPAQKMCIEGLCRAHDAAC